MADSRRSFFPGVILIVLGLIFLLPNFTSWRFDELWPLLILAVGATFLVGYLENRTNYGLLMPATILIVIGCLFLYTETSGWHHMAELWPVFMLAPGIGFFMMYLFGKKEKGLLIPASILTGIGVIFLFGQSEYGYLWPIILIIVGIVLLMNSKPRTPSA